MQSQEEEDEADQENGPEGSAGHRDGRPVFAVCSVDQHPILLLLRYAQGPGEHVWHVCAAGVPSLVAAAARFGTGSHPHRNTSQPFPPAQPTTSRVPPQAGTRCKGIPRLLVGMHPVSVLLQDFEGITPNLLARTIETVEGGGIVVMLLSTLTSLKQLFTLTMDAHSRLKTESHQDVRGAPPGLHGPPLAPPTAPPAPHRTTTTAPHCTAQQRLRTCSFAPARIPSVRSPGQLQLRLHPRTHGARASAACVSRAHTRLGRVAATPPACMLTDRPSLRRPLQRAPRALARALPDRDPRR